VVDDDETTALIIRRTLEKNDFEVVSRSDPEEALEDVKANGFDLIISDYFMPRLNGDELLRAVRNRDQEVAFVFLTSNTDVRVAIELVKSGADDHIVKPVVAEDLLFRVRKNLREREQARRIAEIERERALLDLENKKLVNWRALYASKDIHQTEQMISLLSRTINQSGGFLWVDMLKSNLEKLEDGNYKISPELVEMILESAEGQKKIFDYITFISEIDSIELEINEYKTGDLVEQLVAYAKAELDPLAERHGRSLGIADDVKKRERKVRADSGYLKDIAHELIVNAVKYSPEGSRISLSFDEEVSGDTPVLSLIVRSKPRELSAKDNSGSPIIGIPYDFSELVFDLFYTIEAFPTSIDEERWSDGTGLFVARKLLRRQDGWIRTSNGVDYTGSSPQTFVRFVASLPTTN
jgi:DNA-binding response OmpR family regulator